MKKILVTGGAGYVGSVLCDILLQNNYEVVCLDRFFFGFESISNLKQNSNFSYVKDDIRWFDPNLLKNVFCVIDLASLSNDPSGELDSAKTMEINYAGRVRVAKLAKSMGVERYFLASTCSAYGFNENICNEESKINPLTTYAKASTLAEKEILNLADSKFCTTVFRFATVYGLSKRMRFDLVVNRMTLSLFKNRTISVDGGGKQGRPLVDVRDASQAYVLGIKSDDEIINGQIINVGSNEQNYKMIDLAKEIGDSIGMEYEIATRGDPDFRSYKVDFSKIQKIMKFMPKHTPTTSSREIFNALQMNHITDEIKTKTVEWYSHILKDPALNKDLSINGILL